MLSLQKVAAIRRLMTGVLLVVVGAIVVLESRPQERPLSNLANVATMSIESGLAVPVLPSITIDPIGGTNAMPIPAPDPIGTAGSSSSTSMCVGRETNKVGCSCVANGPPSPDNGEPTYVNASGVAQCCNKDRNEIVPPCCCKGACPNAAECKTKPGEGECKPQTAFVKRGGNLSQCCCVSLAGKNICGVDPKKWCAGAANQAGGKQPGGRQPGGRQPGGRQPRGRRPGGRQPGGRQPGGRQPGGKQAGGRHAGGQSRGSSRRSSASRASDSRSSRSLSSRSMSARSSFGICSATGSNCAACFPYCSKAQCEGMSGCRFSEACLTEGNVKGIGPVCLQSRVSCKPDATICNAGSSRSSSKSKSSSRSQSVSKSQSQSKSASTGTSMSKSQSKSTSSAKTQSQSQSLSKSQSKSQSKSASKSQSKSRSAFKSKSTSVSKSQSKSQSQSRSQSKISAGAGKLQCSSCAACGKGLLNRCDRAECDQLGKGIAKALGATSNLCSYTAGLLKGSCAPAVACVEAEKKAASAKSDAKNVKAPPKLDLTRIEEVEGGYCIIDRRGLSPAGDSPLMSCASNDDCSGYPRVFKSERLCEKFIDRLNGGSEVGLEDLTDEAIDGGYCVVEEQGLSPDGNSPLMAEECRSSVDEHCEGQPAVFPGLELCSAFIDAGDIRDAGLDAFSGIIEPACVQGGVCVTPSSDHCSNGVIFPDRTVCEQLYEQGLSALCEACGEECSEMTCSTLGDCAFIGGSCVPAGE